MLQHIDPRLVEATHNNGLYVCVAKAGHTKQDLVKIVAFIIVENKFKNSVNVKCIFEIYVPIVCFFLLILANFTS